jgi:hypothetical protein
MNRSLEHARLLLAKAAEDEWMLLRTVDDPAAPLAAIGFHAQQAVEKRTRAWAEVTLAKMMPPGSAKAPSVP